MTSCILLHNTASIQFKQLDDIIHFEDPTQESIYAMLRTSNGPRYKIWDMPPEEIMKREDIEWTNKKYIAPYK